VSIKFDFTDFRARSRSALTVRLLVGPSRASICGLSLSVIGRFLSKDHGAGIHLPTRQAAPGCFESLNPRGFRFVSLPKLISFGFPLNVLESDCSRRFFDATEVANSTDALASHRYNRSTHGVGNLHSKRTQQTLGRWRRLIGTETDVLKKGASVGSRSCLKYASDIADGRSHCCQAATCARIPVQMSSSRKRPP